jgi:hypothetical protein
MTFVERTSEELARKIGRRRFLSRAAASVFGIVAAWSVEGIRAPGVLAQECAVRSSQCHCNLPNGTTCPDTSVCTLDQSFYATGCWCTLTCSYGGTCGHYVCCDYINCASGGDCGVATFVEEACPKGRGRLPKG